MKPHGLSSLSLSFSIDETDLVESIGPKTEDLYKKLPCLVCSASASGIHFGAVTCEACKVRFLPTITESEENLLLGVFPSIGQRKCS